MSTSSDTQPIPAATIQQSSGSEPKPKLVGLYGLPGAGKTFLKKHLEKELGTDIFSFYDGSDTLFALAGDGDTFKSLGDPEKEDLRKRAIIKIGKECAEAGRIGVVTGHYMLWNEVDAKNTIWTEADSNTYTHIIHLNTAANVIHDQRAKDKTRTRAECSEAHLCKWNEEEAKGLRKVCRENGILFFKASSDVRTTAFSKILQLLKDMQHHDEKFNSDKASEKLDDIMRGNDDWETMLVLDGDKTLAAEDTGKLFWKQHSDDNGDLLKELFFGMGHTYTAFRQATLLYEEIPEHEFDSICEEIASQVDMHDKFRTLLKRTQEESHVGAIVITSGLRLVWEKVLAKAGLDSVKVIGGGRVKDRYVVTPEVKGSLVLHLKEFHKMKVVAFGDSPLDLQMLEEADQGIVVVGEKHLRSKSMEEAVKGSDGLSRFRQLLLPAFHGSPLLDIKSLPEFDLTTDSDDIIFRQPSEITLITAPTISADILSTRCRDADVSGIGLREAHRRVGYYLAIQHVTELLGTETCPIRHVQKHMVDGYRLKDEDKTLIVALMRGGEPMASGVTEAYPRASFLHAKNPSDIDKHLAMGKHKTIILVDSVINNGTTVIEFARHIRTITKELPNKIRVVVVTQVAQALAKDKITEALTKHESLTIVALRTSNTYFIGTKTTDTGSRLFNTTYLD